MAVVAKISCGGVAVNLTIYPVDFQFLQFEQWLRGKFTLCEGAKLTFRDRMGNECLITKSFFYNNQELMVEVEFETRKAGSGTATSSGQAAVVSLLSLDSYAPDEAAPPECASVEAGDCVYLADGREVRIPPWLKGRQPLSALAAADESLVDFSLPLQTNPFHKNMENTIAGSAMGKAFDAIDTSNILLLGSSGCGKTSACFALAAKRYVIFLECPAGSELARGGTCRGYRMSKAGWWGNLRTEEEVKELFCCELAARLIVLVNLLRKHGATVSPLCWLRYVQSVAGETRIGKVFDELLGSVDRVSFHLVQQLITTVQQLQVRPDAVGNQGALPVLFVDEVQLLAPLPAVTCAGTPGPLSASISVMKAVIQAAGVFSWGSVWSGTRMGVTAANGQDSGIAKELKGSRELKVVGDFQYLEPRDVNLYLNAVLEHSASDAVRRQLCHLLQGRAQMVTGFIALLLKPLLDERGNLTMRGAGQNSLNDEILLDTLELFMETSVVKRFQGEVNYVMGLPGSYALDRDDLGHLWCLSTLPTLNTASMRPSVAVARLDSLAFTSHVYEVTNEFSQTATVTYAFDYRFGEPGLQEALRRIVVLDAEVADRGIRSLLHGALTPSALGSYLDFAVVLALVSRQQTVLADLCADHATFRHFAKHELVITRVVATHSAKKQLEWFEKVTANPDDDTFSLLPGVPVRYIAILPCTESGADVICVAVAPAECAAKPCAAKSDSQLPAAALYADQLASRPKLASPPTSPQYLRSSKRKRRLDKQLPSATSQQMERLVVIHFCCASYAGSVPAAKHLDQEKKSAAQFTGNAPSQAGKQYRKLFEERRTQFQCMPVLVEIPQSKPVESDKYVLITEKNAGAFFSSALVDVFTGRGHVV